MIDSAMISTEKSAINPSAFHHSSRVLLFYGCFQRSVYGMAGKEA